MIVLVSLVFSEERPENDREKFAHRSGTWQVMRAFLMDFRGEEAVEEWESLPSFALSIRNE
jgi:hypothetical protein